MTSAITRDQNLFGFDDISDFNSFFNPVDPRSKKQSPSHFSASNISTLPKKETCCYSAIPLNLSADKTHSITHKNVIQSNSQKASLGGTSMTSQGFVSSLSGKVPTAYYRFNKIIGDLNPPGLVGLGVTNTFGFIGSVNTSFEGYKSWKATKGVDDIKGKALAGIKLTRGVLKTTSGAVTLPFRALSAISHINPASVVATISGVCFKVGSVFSRISNLLTLTSFSIKLFEQHFFNRDLKRITKEMEEPVEARARHLFEFLKESINLSEKEKLSIRENVYRQRSFCNWTDKAMNRVIRTREDSSLAGKEKKLKRLTCSRCVKLIKNGDISKAEIVFSEVKGHASYNTIMTSIGLTLGVLGLICSLILAVATSPIALAVASAIGLVTSTSFFALDIYSFISALRSDDKPGKYDKLYLFLSSLIAVITTAVAVLLSTSVVSIAFSVIFGVAWLTINAITYYHLHKIESDSFSIQKE